MATRIVFLLFMIIFSACGSNSKEESQQSEIRTAKDLILHSVAYHDPDENWGDFRAKVQSNSLIWRDNGVKEKNARELFIDNPNGAFEIHSISDKVELKGEVSSDTCYSKILTEVTEEVASKYKRVLGCEGINFFKDYYSYLIGMPMKLLDPEAIVNDTIFERSHNGVKYNVVKVNYDPIEENPLWYFYFDKKNHSFQLCKFTSWNDESEGGEYIIYREEKNVQHMKLYSQQVWLYNRPTLDSLAVDELQFIP